MTERLPGFGYIIDGRDVIGTFSFSFHSCKFSWEAKGTIHHFYSEEELKTEVERNNWKLVSPELVKIIKTYIGR